LLSVIFGALPDQPVAFDQAPRLDVVALRAFLHEHLARFEVPRYILPVKAPLPRTASVSSRR
jgi:hypothetical protein